MKRQRTFPIAVVATIAVAGCGAARFELRSPPTLPDQVSLPSPPPVPEAEAASTAASPEVERQVTAAHQPADLRPDVVALVLDAPADFRATVLNLLGPILIGRGYTRILYPFAVQEVRGRLDRTETTGIRTSVEGRLDQLALLRASTPASYLLALEIRESAATSEAHTTYRIPPDALARYSKARTAFQRQIAPILSRIRFAGSSYADEVREARATYEADGGTYGAPEERSARDRANAFLSEFAVAEARVASVLSSAPAPEALERRAAAADTTLRTPLARILMRGTLTDLRAGETFWMVDVTATAPERNDALTRALQALVESLGQSG